MSIIQKSAYAFLPERNDRPSHIVFRDGRVSPSFISKRAGEMAVEHSLLMGYMTVEEGKAVLDQIDRSNRPYDVMPADVAVTMKSIASDPGRVISIGAPPPRSVVRNN